MLHINDCAVCVMPPATCSSGETHTMTIDCADFDQMNVIVGMMTHDTSKAALATCSFTEGTNSAAGTAIVALTGGTSVVADSTGFTIPTGAYMGLGSVMEFQIDLKKRKRYLNLVMTPGDSTATGTYAVARLSRGTYSRDTAAEKHCLNYSNTNNTNSIAVLVTA